MNEVTNGELHMLNKGAGPLALWCGLLLPTPQAPAVQGL